MDDENIDDPLTKHIVEEFAVRELIGKLVKTLVDKMFEKLPTEGNEAAFYARQIAELVISERQIAIYKNTNGANNVDPRKFTMSPDNIMRRLNLTSTQYKMGIKFAEVHGILNVIMLTTPASTEDKMQ